MTGWAFETLTATTFLMLAVLALREPVARRFGATAAYLLWLAPAARMILPPLPVGWIGARDDAMGMVVPIFGDAAPTIGSVSAPILPATNWQLLALAIWLGGATLFFAWHCISYARFVSRARDTADWLYAEDSIEIASSPAVASPVAFGIFGKAVMIPADFDRRYNPLEQRLALAHEVAHHHRHDLPANLIALMMLSLHWFNPVAHFAHRAFRIDQEAACDAQILAGASPQERHAYGTALFKSATAGTPLAACAMGAATTIKARLSRIVTGGGTAATPRMLAGLATTIAALVLLTASGEIIAQSANSEPESAPILVLGGATIQPLAPTNFPNASAKPVAPLAKRVSLRTHAASEPPAAVSISDVIAPPAAPEAPAPPVAEIATQPPVAPAAMAFHARHISCANGARPHFLSRSTAVEGQNRSEIRIMICNTANAAEARGGMRDALNAARKEIADDQVIGAMMRDRLLAAIDRQIAEAGRRQSGAGPVPLYSLQ